MKRIILIMTVLLMTAQTAAADSISYVNRWYSALRTVNRPVFDQLLANSAKIELKQLSVVQDKSEFIESLDNWEDVAGDVLISTTINGSDGEKIEVSVCYQFASDAFTNRETFWIADGKIIRQVQEKLQEGC